jgi:hypothetical protein
LTWELPAFSLCVDLPVTSMTSMTRCKA